MRLDTIKNARSLAFYLLEGLDNRLKHTLTVVSNCEDMANVLGLTKSKKETLLIAAYLHDIGYSEKLSKTNFHPYDGYQYLKHNFWRHDICQLVLRHSEAEFLPQTILLDLTELYEQGISEDIEFLYKILTIADMTSDFDGTYTTMEKRYLGIMNRYGATSPVTKHAAKMVARATTWERELGLAVNN